MNRREFINVIAVQILATLCVHKLRIASAEETGEVSLSEDASLSEVIGKIKTSKSIFTPEGEILFNKKQIVYVDFSKNSDLPRFQIFNDQKELILSSRVSHGIKSGNRFATEFSNDMDSYQSSLGIYVTGKKYIGSFGLSLNLHGLSPGNFRAYQRRIVIHGARYCSQNHIDKYGFLGRSQGCFTVPQENSVKIINQLNSGTVIVAYRSALSDNRVDLYPATREESANK